MTALHYWREWDFTEKGKAWLAAAVVGPEQVPRSIRGSTKMILPLLLSYSVPRVLFRTFDGIWCNHAEHRHEIEDRKEKKKELDSSRSE